MENASKALLISGGILVAILVLTLGVALFAEFSGSGEIYENRQIVAEIRKFNANFTKFEDRDDITAQEIITLNEFVKQYNEKNETNVEVKINPKITNNIEFLQKNSVDETGNRILFKCDSDKIEYDEEGKVRLINFEILK